MKTKLIALFVGLMTISMYAQKNEVKAAEKALKKNNFSAAATAIQAAEGLIGSMDDKTKAKFYFLKGKTHLGKKDFSGAADAFEQLKSLENKTGKIRYSKEAQPLITQMVNDVYKLASDQYTSKNYKEASDNFYLTYKLSPQDTTFIYNAAISSTLTKDYDSALKYYKELQDMGYTGIKTLYFAVNKETGVKENLGSKQNRDLYVKSGQYKDPSQETSESKLGEIIKNVAYILKEQGKTEEAIAAIKKARAIYPKDLNLILTEADIYIQLKQMDKFGELMKLAVEQDPTNPILYFNLGVVTQDQENKDEAKKYYEKAVELKPDYGDAYMNLAVIVLDKEKPIIEEMNKNLSDFDKYDKLLAKQKEVYKEALPYLEKADKYGRNINTVRTLMNMYESLAMDAKAKEYRDLFNKMRKK